MIIMIYDTIVAKTTGNGTSAINMIRISGSESFDIVQKIFKGSILKNQPSHTAHYGFIYNGNEQIDEVIVTVFKSPKTFTTEDTVEITCHGGNFIANEIIKHLIANGARLAEKGEFSKRAYLNGRIDLTEAESIMDLVNSKTINQLKIANSQLKGDVLNLVDNLQNSVLDIIANIEVNIDYPEYDDVTEMTNEIVIPNIKILLEKIEKILRESSTGQIIRDGIKTVIIGKPNVGKSSLLNTLIKEDKAIVTEISGTTRDLIEAELNLDGVILKLIDTAGIRITDDIVEKIGIDKTKKALEEADLILLVLDQSTNITDMDNELLEITKNKQRIIIGNKIDLGSKINLVNEHIINISAKNNIGIDKLSEEVKKLFIDEKLLESDYTILSNTRHIGKLEETKIALLQALQSAEEQIPIDMVEIDLREAWSSLGEITGDNTSDDLISTLFSKFCLGK
ncbi:MAG: tRNA uridine-5-carboxymethylaminomethyl(34) synthesis GTPase MnmE [Candidatus Izemoplasmatales bacterium]